MRSLHEGNLVDAARKSLAERIEEKIERVTESGCWIWIGSHQSERWNKPPRPVMRCGGKHAAQAHRIAYECFVGPIPHGLFVCHRCDVPSCVNPAHLFVGSRQENMDDMVRKGRSSRLIGERGPGAKLTATDVRAIRARYIPKDSLNCMRAIAADYGVTETTIHAIIRGKRWAHVG